MDNKNWNEAESLWDQNAVKAAKTHPLKVLKNFPTMPGMTEDTAKNLKWKSLKWMLQKDKDWRVFRNFLNHPFLYFTNYLKSIFSKNPFVRQGDFFFLRNIFLT